MHSVYFDVHRQTDSRTLLRQMDTARRIQKQRELNPAEIEQFVTQVKRDYASAFNLLDTPRLKALGQRLYTWLDGPTERWLATLRRDHPLGWALHIDVEVKLRHLPWELMHDGGQWLGGHAHQPFTPVRHVCERISHPAADAPNRPLRVLFMACSPRNVTPVLDYEHEEIAILEAASKHGIELVVEETGTLDGLKERLSDYEAGYFDVLHLTGHADLINNKPVFLMEDDFGQRFDASPDHILRACGGRLPRLMFLSGCSSGRAPEAVADANDNVSASASLCEEMVKHGVSAALGWALPVYDHSASAAAACLYEKLANGTQLDEAVARTRHMLLEDHPKMWHLLRLYADANPLTALVTAPKAKDRAVLPPTPDVITQLRDLGGKIEVCERKHFVGRRREVQRSLRCLKARLGDDGYAEGVLLQGMGGMGKSSLMARLCDRLPEYQRLIWVGRVDWPAFMRGLSEAPDLSAALAAVEMEQRKTSIKLRLRQLLRQPSLIAKPALFIFDDFEQNLSGHHPSQPQYQIGRDGHYAVEADTLEIVAALMAAIRDEASHSRVLLTSRYQPALPPPARLLPVPLTGMNDPDLGKKAEQLAQLRLARRHPDRQSLFARALTLSAGNPRLLTHLNTAFERDDDGALDLAALLQRLEATTADFREALLLRSLLDTLSDETRHALAGLALFETPVPNAALAALLACPPRASQAMLSRVVASGLAEQHEMGGAEKDPRYFVNPLVAALLPPYPAQSADYARAAAWLHKTWWEERDGFQMDEALEVQRLALFGQMCAVAVELGDRLSNALIRQYRYSEAAALCQRSLPVCPHNQLYMWLGRAQQALGEVDAAEHSFQQALQSYRAALGSASPDAAAQKDYAVIAHNYGTLLHARGDFEAALPYFEQSLAIQQQIGDKQGEGTTLNNISQIYHARGDYDTALTFLKQSLAIRQQIGDKQGEGQSLNNISQIYHARGDYDTALSFLKQSLAIQQQIGDKSGEGTTLNNISQIYHARGDYDTALSFLKQSLAIQQQIGDVAGLCATLFNMGHIHWQNNEQAEALQAWVTVYDLAKKLNLAQTLAALTGLAQRLGLPGGLAGWEWVSAGKFTIKKTQST